MRNSRTPHPLRRNLCRAQTVTGIQKHNHLSPSPSNCLGPELLTSKLFTAVSVQGWGCDPCCPWPCHEGCHPRSPPAAGKVGGTGVAGGEPGRASLYGGGGADCNCSCFGHSWYFRPLLEGRKGILARVFSVVCSEGHEPNTLMSQTILHSLIPIRSYSLFFIGRIFVHSRVGSP